MGFRFQKRLKIFPGLKLNLSKSGISWTIGTRGMSINAKDRKITGNVGIPGTGFSYREQLNRNVDNSEKPDLSDSQIHPLNISQYFVIFILLIIGILIGISIS